MVLSRSLLSGVVWSRFPENIRSRAPRDEVLLPQDDERIGTTLRAGLVLFVTKWFESKLVADKLKRFATTCLGLLMPRQLSISLELLQSKLGRFLFLGHDRSVRLTAPFVGAADRSVLWTVPFDLAENRSVSSMTGTKTVIGQSNDRLMTVRLQKERSSDGY